MKKITTISAVAIFAIAIASCSKSSSGYLPSSLVLQTASKQEPVKVRLISDWQSLSMTSTITNGNSQLAGQSTLPEIISYETGMHKQFAYVKMQGRDGSVYKALPTSYSTLDGIHMFSFSLDFSTFRVSISNVDFPARLVNPQSFSNFQYRYIVIPVEIYNSYNIDWNDLTQVAAALNFSL